MAKIAQLVAGDYNVLDNIPVINQDLTASGFTPVANTYYKHTGATTDTFTQGIIYLYDTAYHKLGESGGGGLNQYSVRIEGDEGFQSYTFMDVLRRLSLCEGNLKVVPDGDTYGCIYAGQHSRNVNGALLEFNKVDMISSDAVVTKHVRLLMKQAPAEERTVWLFIETITLKSDNTVEINDEAQIQGDLAISMFQNMIGNRLTVLYANNVEIPIT